MHTEDTVGIVVASIGLACLLSSHEPNLERIKPSCVQQFNNIVELQSGIACINELGIPKEERFKFVNDQLRLACTAYKLDRCDDELSVVYKALEKKLMVDKFDPCTYIPEVNIPYGCYFDQKSNYLFFNVPFEISE